jgi:hypothetical protein
MHPTLVRCFPFGSSYMSVYHVGNRGCLYIFLSCSINVIIHYKFIGWLGNTR